MTQREAMRQGLGQTREYPMLSRSMSAQLNGSARVRITQTGPLVYWIEAPQAPGYWVKIPLSGYQENNLEFLTFYLSSIGFLSVLGGWLFARHLNRPLKALQQAAVKVGKRRSFSRAAIPRDIWLNARVTSITSVEPSSSSLVLKSPLPTFTAACCSALSGRFRWRANNQPPSTLKKPILDK